MEIIKIQNLNFTYPKHNIKALDDITMSVNSGDFIVICGESGCGKTTLLKLLKPQIAPFGIRSGEIFYKSTNIDILDERTSSCEIGFVMQNPETQIVTDKVWHELAFGLENMGIETQEIRRRTAEMASFFNISEWFRKKTADLSGGQKQLLNLASVLVMQPEILILDEPTSQLDPIAASDFILTLQKLNRELGLTVILVEHRMEDVFPIADKVAVLEKGKLLMYGTPQHVGSNLRSLNPKHPILYGIPSAMRIYSALNISSKCPVTVKEGRSFIHENFDNKIKRIDFPEFIPQKEITVELKNIWFRYEKVLPDIIKGMDLQVHKGEILSILGGNGTGKTTVLSLIAGQNIPYCGTINIKDKNIKKYKNSELYKNNITLLPQNPLNVFLKDNLKDDYKEICKVMDYNTESSDIKINEIAEMLNIKDLLDCHPYDLSGGEQQKAALAKIMLLKPEILLLDEPTKGIDAYSKKILINILKNLRNKGLTIIIVSHDIEFAALCSDRCALFFDGKIISSDVPAVFFSTGNFYTTSARRISRGIYDNAVTCEDIIRLCRLNGEKKHD